jgi:hypothetical protein
MQFGRRACFGEVGGRPFRIVIEINRRTIAHSGASPFHERGGN